MANANKNNVTKRGSLNRPLTVSEGDQNFQELINVIEDLEQANVDTVIYADTITNLLALDTATLKDGQQASVRGTEMRWSESEQDWRVIGDITVEAFGATCDGQTDDSAAFQSAANFARDNNCAVIGLGNGEGYFLNSTVTLYTGADIRAEVVFPADGQFRYLRVESTKTPELIDFSTLSGLNEFSAKVSGLPASAAGKYVWIESNEVLTERNNPPSNTPYEKRSAFYVLSTAGDITPSLDTTFNAGYNTTVKVFPEEKRIDVKVAGLSLVGTGAGNAGIVLVRDNTHLTLGTVSAPDSEFRTIVGVQANGCTIDCQSLNDAAFEGLGYGININLSCNTTLLAPRGASSRTELDGRHGANVVVNGGAIQAAGSHWGNSYKFNDCDVGTYTFAGKDLTISGGSYGAIYMRADVSLCTGLLSVRGAKRTGAFIDHIVPSGNVIAGIFTTPRRFFDEVDIEGLVSRGSTGFVLYGGGGSTNPSAAWLPPKRITVRNVSSEGPCSGFAFALDNAVSLATPPNYTFEDIKSPAAFGDFLTVRGFLANTSSHGINFTLRNCGELGFAVDANAIESMEIFDSTVTKMRRVNGSAARGKVILNNCKYAPSTPSYIESKREFINVIYQGNVAIGGGSVDGFLVAQIGCRALPGATGYPTPLSYYVSTTDYA